MTATRFSIHALNPKLRKQALEKLAAAGTVRTNILSDEDAANPRRMRGKGKKSPKIPKLSAPEEKLAFHLKAEGVTDFERQFKWHPDRKFRADFAWPSKRLLVEVQGGIHNNGAHVRGKGYEHDRARTNEAVLLGYRMLEFTPHQIHQGAAVRMVRRALEMA